MNQTKLLFPLIFISLEDDSSIVIPPQPTSPGEIMSGGEGEPVEADEPEEGENDTTPAETERTISGVLASTKTVTHATLSPRQFDAEKTDHVHCEICWAKFSKRPEDLHFGYYEEKSNSWICEECFQSFGALFHWQLK